MNRRSFLAALLAPVMAAVAVSRQKYNPIIPLGSPDTLDGDRHFYGRSLVEDWRPYRLSSRTESHPEVEAHFARLWDAWKNVNTEQLRG